MKTTRVLLAVTLLAPFSGASIQSMEEGSFESIDLHSSVKENVPGVREAFVIRDLLESVSRAAMFESVTSSNPMPSDEDDLPPFEIEIDEDEEVVEGQSKSEDGIFENFHSFVIVEKETKVQSPAKISHSHAKANSLP